MLKSQDKSHDVAGLFVSSCGPVFALTGAAKLLSAFGHAKILLLLDPIVGIQFRYLMFFAGCVELGVAYTCLFTNNAKSAVAITAWLSTLFVGYRIGLWWVGWRYPCSCLGNLTDALVLPPKVLGVIMKTILIYLFAGSYSILFSLQWTQGVLSDKNPT